MENGKAYTYTQEYDAEGNGYPMVAERKTEYIFYKVRYQIGKAILHTACFCSWFAL